MSRVWVKNDEDTEVFTITWYGSDSSINYALDVTESITSSTWVLPAGVTEVSSSNTTTTTSIFISGGTVNERYEITNVIETDSGRTLGRSVYLHVKELWVN